MKLQQRTNRRVGDKEYLKWYVDIPSEIINEVGWKEKIELEADVKGHKIVLKPKKST